jgi:hypothetical protein
MVNILRLGKKADSQQVIPAEEVAGQDLTEEQLAFVTGGGCGQSSNQGQGWGQGQQQSSSGHKKHHHHHHQGNNNNSSQNPWQPNSSQNEWQPNSSQC